MPPKPARSKACTTCLKRKKGCDLQRPACGQCRKSCIPCGGYDKGFLFVNSEPPKMAALISSAAKQRRANAKAARDRLTNDLPASPPAGPAYEVACMALFWQSYLPNGRALPAKVARNTVGGWIDAMQVLSPSDDILRKAILAVSLSTIGRRDDNRWMKDEGIRFYCAALQEMSTALIAPKRSKSHDGLLAAIRVFSLYEILYGGSGEASRPAQISSWIWHNSGEIAWIMDRTPSHFVSGHAHRLFVDGRLHLTGTALRMRKKIFLSEPAWKTIPWSQQPKTPRDIIMDILVDIPSIYERVDFMLSCEDLTKKEDCRKYLIQECLTLDRQLADCRDKFNINPPSSILSADGFTADELSSLFVRLLYWTTCIMVNAMLHCLASARDNEKAQQQVHSDSNACSQNIITGVSQLLRPEVGLFRVHLSILPITVAVIHLATTGPAEMTAAKKMLAEYWDKPEFATIRRFLSALEPESVRSFMEQACL